MNVQLDGTSGHWIRHTAIMCVMCVCVRVARKKEPESANLQKLNVSNPWNVRGQSACTCACTVYMWFLSFIPTLFDLTGQQLCIRKPSLCLAAA